MNLLEAMIEIGTIGMLSQFGALTSVEFLLFDFVGPLLNPLQLRGPLSLRGWDFPTVMLSTILLVSYFSTAIQTSQVAEPGFRIGRSVRFSLLILPLFLIPAVRLAARLGNQGS